MNYIYYPTTIKQDSHQAELWIQLPPLSKVCHNLNTTEILFISFKRQYLYGCTLCGNISTTHPIDVYSILQSRITHELKHNSMSHLIQQILPLIKNEIHYMNDDSHVVFIKHVLSKALKIIINL